MEKSLGEKSKTKFKVEYCLDFMMGWMSLGIYRNVSEMPWKKSGVWDLVKELFTAVYLLRNLRQWWKISNIHSFPSNATGCCGISKHMYSWTKPLLSLRWCQTYVNLYKFNQTTHPVQTTVMGPIDFIRIKDAWRHSISEIIVGNGDKYYPTLFHMEWPPDIGENENSVQPDWSLLHIQSWNGGCFAHMACTGNDMTQSPEQICCYL